MNEIKFLFFLLLFKGFLGGEHNKNFEIRQYNKLGSRRRKNKMKSKLSVGKFTFLYFSKELSF